MRAIQFFEDDKARLSMPRLLFFLSFFPASYILIKDGDADMLGWYLGAYALAYVGGKLSPIRQGEKDENQ